MPATMGRLGPRAEQFQAMPTEYPEVLRRVFYARRAREQREFCNLLDLGGRVRMHLARGCDLETAASLASVSVELARKALMLDDLDVRGAFLPALEYSDDGRVDLGPLLSPGDCVFIAGV